MKRGKENEYGGITVNISAVALHFDFSCDLSGCEKLLLQSSVADTKKDRRAESDADPKSGEIRRGDRGTSKKNRTGQLIIACVS